jgi:hypothetical protein
VGWKSVSGFCVIRKREIWEGRYHEASGFSCLVDVGLQEWHAWQGSGRVLKIEETITIVDTATAVTHLWLGEE